MSKSKRKTPIAGITIEKTEKEDKRIANRRVRHMNKKILNATLDDTQLKDIKEISDVWDFHKDGKQYFGYLKDKIIKEKLMRK